MRLWCTAQRISVFAAMAFAVPATSLAQQPMDSPAYQHVMDRPFARNNLEQIPAQYPSSPDFTPLQRVTAIDSSILLNDANQTIQTNAEVDSAPSLINDSPTTSDSNQVNSSEDSKSAHLVVQPPLVQPYKNNQYSFVIENLGQLDAEEVQVEISVNENARIVAMLPSEAVVTDKTALLSIARLHAGEHINIHLTATSDDKSPIQFSAKLVQTSKQTFQPATGSTSLAVGPTKRPVTSSKAFSVKALPASTPTNGVPIVSTQPETYRPRPHFQTNPHYAGEPSASPLNNPLKPRRRFQSVSSGNLRTKVGPIAQRPNATIGEQEFASQAPSTIDSFPNNEAPTFTFGDTLMEETQVSRPTDEPTILDDAVVSNPLAEDTSAVELGTWDSPVDGPRNMEILTIRDFQLNIQNPKPHEISDVLIQLQIPRGMQIMSFDRESWFDEESNTVSFRIARLPAGNSEQVNYQLKAAQGGFQIQKLLVEANEVDAEEVRFDTFVRE